MSDSIKRQAAINTVHEMRKKCDTDIIDDYEEMLAVALGELCTAQRTGRWRHYEGSLTCTECGIEYYDDIMEYCGDAVPRFCPNCGARMEGE